MNIAMITPQWLRTVGGPTTTVFNLANRMRRLGHRVEVLTSECDSGAITFTDRAPRREVEIFKHLVRINTDIIHIHGSVHFIPAAWLYKIFQNRKAKIIFTLHTQPVFKTYLPDSIPIKDSYRGFRRFIANMLMRCSDRIVTVSKDIVENFVEHRKFRIPNYSIISSGGAPLSAIAKQDNRTDEKSAFPVLSTVGVFSWDWKVAGHVLAIAAVDILRKQYPSVKLVIVGDGQYRGYIEKCIDDAGVRAHVDLRGSMSDPRRVVAASDIYVHMGLNEGSPLSLVEAMFVGKPIIAVNSGGIPELIHHNDTGILVDAAPEAVAIAVRDLLLDPGKASRLAKNAHSFAVQFLDWDVIAKRYLEVYTA